MSSIHFESTYDNSKLIRGINQDNQTVGQWAKNIQTQGAGIENTFNNITRAAGAYLSLRFASQIGREIINVRGEFQQLGIAFETMLNSKEKADKLMAESIVLAQRTPFTLLDVTTNIKQLMAMGIEYENVMGTLRSLGDVAAGVSVPLSRIAINYGQVATLGKLQQREIRDFAMAGVPLVDELAKNLGKAKEEIYDMVSAGQVGFKDVEKAFQTMSGEGGKFYNLMEKQNASVTGQISNLQDKIQVMLNAIGKSNEGVIYGGISGLAELITHYEDVLDILKVLVATYGAYKAALIATAAAQGIMRLSENVQLIMMFRKELGLATAAQQAFNITAKANPYGLILAGITALVTAFIVFRDTATDVEKAQEKITAQVNEQRAKIESLVTQIKSENTANADKAKALKALNDISPEYLGNLNAQNLSTKEGKTAIDNYVTSLERKLKLEDLERQLKESFDRENQARTGSIPVSIGMMAFQTGQDQNILAERYRSELIYNEKEKQDLIKKGIEALISGNKKEVDSGKDVLTISQQIAKTKKDIFDAEKALSDMRKPESKSTKKDIEDQEALIESYKKSLETLTGVKQKEKKQVDELKVANEELEKAIKKGDQAAIERSSKKVAALEKEKNELEKIIAFEVWRAANPETAKQLDAAMKANKPISSISKDIEQVGQTKTVKGILYEITAIDKTGPVWKKVKIESDEIKEKAKKDRNEAFKDQEELDQKELERKKNIQEEILYGARQFTGELIDQLDLTTEQKNQLQGVADIAMNIATGNYFAAGFGALSQLMMLMTGKTKEDPTIKSLNAINDLLQQQSAILANLSGQNYFELAAKQLSDYNEAIELNNKKLQESLLYLKKFDYESVWKGFVDRGEMSLENYNKLVNAVKKSIDGTATPQDFIDAYVNGSIALDEQQLEWINGILEAQSARAELMQETFRKALGFDSGDISSSIHDGIWEGLQLGKDSLGDFAESFGDLMKKALMQSVTDSFNIKLTEGWLKQFNEFMQGGLTEEERKKLEEDYKILIQEEQAKIDAIKNITDQYTTTAAKAMTGSIKSLTEETGSELAGITRKTSDDVRVIRDYTKIGINHLVNIEANTFNTVVELKNAVTELKAINTNTKQSPTGRDLGL